jgi:hypothetical protein
MLEDMEEQFLADGFIVVPIPGITKRLHSALLAYERLIANAEHLGRMGQAKVRKSDLVGSEGAGWSWGCDHIYAPVLREQVLLDLASLDPIPSLVRRILGERVRFSGGHGHWSPVRYDYFLHWHRDTRRERWHIGNPDARAHVQVCIALTDEAVVHVVPGSHLRDLEPWEQRYVTTDPHGNHPAQVIAQVAAGSALLLNTYTFHRAQCRKENMRRSLHYGFTRVGSESEPGRQGKVLEWLCEPGFLTNQSAFLRACIEEQIKEQSALL